MDLHLHMHSLWELQTRIFRERISEKEREVDSVLKRRQRGVSKIRRADKKCQLSTLQGGKDVQGMKSREAISVCNRGDR